MTTATMLVTDRQAAWAFLARNFITLSRDLATVLWPGGDLTAEADAESVVARILDRDDTLPASILAATAHPRSLDEARLSVEYARAAGWRAITPDDSEWPIEALTGAYHHVAANMPAVLWVHGTGNLREATRQAVTITGTSPLSPTQQQHTATLAGDLAARGYTVISGGMHSHAEHLHPAAHEAGGTTIAVLDHGPFHRADTNTTRYQQISDSGLLVTAALGDTGPGYHQKLIRNALFCALSSGVVLTDTDITGYHTPWSPRTWNHGLDLARRATSIDRPVMCLPGAVDEREQEGTNRLLADGTARPVLTASDVLDVIDPEDTAQDALYAWPVDDDTVVHAAANTWTSAHQQVRQALGEYANTGRSLSAVAADCGMTVRLVVRLIGDLEARQALVRNDGWWY